MDAVRYKAMEGQYPDEIILKERNRREKERKRELIRELSRNVECCPEELFEEVELGEGAARIRIPRMLEAMPPAMVAKRYPFEPQPSVVRTMGDGAVDFTFSCADVRMDETELEEAVAQCRRGIAHLFPSTLFYEQGQEQVDGNRVYWFTYAGNTADFEKIYAVQFFAAMEKVICGSMVCRYELHEEWGDIAMLCMRTLRGRKGNGQGGAFAGRE